MRQPHFAKLASKKGIATHFSFHPSNFLINTILNWSRYRGVETHPSRSLIFEGWEALEGNEVL